MAITMQIKHSADVNTSGNICHYPRRTVCWTHYNGKKIQCA